MLFYFSPKSILDATPVLVLLRPSKFSKQQSSTGVTMFIFFSKILKMNGDLKITMHTSKAVYENLFPDISRFSRVTPDVPPYVPTKTSVTNITSYILVEKCDRHSNFLHTHKRRRRVRTDIFTWTRQSSPH